MRWYQLLLIGIALMIYGTYYDYKTLNISAGFFTYNGIFLIGVFVGHIASKL